MTDRARVPFALIGVLLLVASGTVAVSQHGQVLTEPAVDRTMDRLTAETQSALRSAVHEAARNAASRPVVDVANTTAGRALNDTTPFRDALRLRIYLAAKANLDGLSTERRGVDRTASLPPVGNHTAGVRRAIERVSVSQTGPDGQMLRVQLDGLELLATRGGGLGGEAQHVPTFVVDTPILAVHDRVDQFDDRLDAPVGQPGLATRASAVLYPIAWARGYAQYRGGPIENVVANRHVALATNGAVLGEQRRAFGTSDPVGRTVYLGALADVSFTDLAGVANSSILERLEGARTDSSLSRTPGEGLPLPDPGSGTPSLETKTTVAVGRAADRAYLDALAAVNRTTARTYAPDVRARASVRTVDRHVRSRHSPGGGWELDDEHVTYDTTVSNRRGTIPESADGWHRFAGYSRTVDVVKRTVRHWDKPDNTTGRTERVVNLTRDVDLVVEGTHVVGPAPNGTVRSVHEPGGPLDGPNLADARKRILEHVDHDRGGGDHLAAMAATDRPDTDPRPVQAARPSGLSAWARTDLPELRRTVRSIEVSVPRGEIASFQTSIPAELADEVRDRRAALVDAPATYGNVAERARVGVRADYVDRVLDRLERRAEQHDAATAQLDDALPETEESATDLLADGVQAVHGGGRASNGDGIDLSVTAEPAYLPTKSVGDRSVPAIPANRTEHPLVVRNVNAVSVPASGVVEGLFGLLSGPKETSLETATQVLRTVESELQETAASNPVVESLDDQVGASVEDVRLAVREELERRELGTAESRESVVESALSRWDGTAPRASAIVNGSFAAAINEEVIGRWPDAAESGAARDRLAVAVDLAVVEARNETDERPHLSTVNATVSVARAELESRVQRITEETTNRAKDAAKQRVRKQVAAISARFPSGVPLAPAPGMWYATVNAWHVQMRGSYARFAVAAAHGSPERVPASLTYVRENRTVSLDVDDDGRPERLGANRRISFDAETVIGVAVPPGAQGVGDVTARDERSPGWPDPGPVPNATSDR